jgi:molybdopterin-guanine dinucleotide biosynthesis adapter protein
MKVCGFCGASGAGKTTLIEGVLAALKAAGQRVSVVKHAGHGFEIDVPGKDSWRMRQAGAFEVVIASKNRLAKVREYEVEGEPSVHQMLAELAEVDWVLVEGFKHADLMRIEVWRAALDRPAQYPVDPFVVAVVTDTPAALPEATARPVFAADDAAGVAAFLLASGERHRYAHHG